MPYQNEDVCHFRHCARIRCYARSSSNAAVYLTMQISESVPTGVLMCATPQNAYKNQTMWLLTDRPGDDEVGVGYLATTFGSTTSGSIYSFFHNFSCSASSGATPIANMSRGNTYSDSEKFVFIPRSNLDDSVDTHRFVIMKPGTQLCLTAGSSASGTAVQGQCYLTTWSDAANQMWWIEDPHVLANVYQVAPALDPSLCIATPGQVKQDQSTLGIQAFDETDMTAVWSGHYVVPSTGILNDSTPLYYPVSPGSDKLNFTGVPQVTWPPVEYQLQQISETYHDDRSFVVPAYATKYDEGSEYAGGGYITETGTYKAYQLGPLGSSYPLALSSRDGDLSIGNSPWMRNAVSDTSLTNAEQFWLPLPRNFYDPSMPTPYDMQIICRDITTGDEWTLESADEIPDGPIELIPRFICDWDAFSAVIKIRFKDKQYRIAGDDWGDWSWIKTPRSSNLPMLSQSPWSVPDGPEAWIPNAWSTEPDADGYRRLNRGFYFAQSLFSDHPGEIAEISVSVRAFGHRPERSYPWEPYHGAAATRNILLSQKPTVSLISSYVSSDGMHLGYRVTNNFPGSGQLSLGVVSILPTYVGPIDYGTYDVKHESLADSFDDVLGTSEGEIIVPIENFKADVLSEIIRALSPQGNYLRANVGLKVTTQFAIQTIYMSVTIEMESGASALDTSSYRVSEIGQLATLYERSGLDMIMDSSYQLVRSERGARFRRIFDRTTYAVALHMTGQPFGPGDSAHKTLLFMRSSDSNDLRFAIVETPGTGKRIIASIAWLEEAYHIIHIIPVEGNISFDRSFSFDITTAQRLGAKSFIASTNGGQTPTISFTGTLFKGEFSRLTGIQPSVIADVAIDTGLSAIFAIPDDQVLLLRTTYGTAYAVKIAKISVPRTNSQMAQLTIDFIEVS